MKRELIEISETIRVENGPARKRAVATKELLDDKVTASHYQEGLKDAAGRKIVLGEEMFYLDYRGPWVWYIYQLKKVGVNAEGRVVGIDADGRLVESPDAVSTQERFVVMDVQPTQEAALTVAHGLEE